MQIATGWSISLGSPSVLLLAGSDFYTHVLLVHPYSSADLFFFVSLGAFFYDASMSTSKMAAKIKAKKNCIGTNRPYRLMLVWCV